MIKDLVIDNSVSHCFCNPTQDEYKDLIKWLIDENRKFSSMLAVSQKLLNEYHDTSKHALSNTSLPALIDLLTREGRLNFISKKDIQSFSRKYITKSRRKKLKSNSEDHPHLITTFLSERKLAISEDDNLIHDLLNFPKHSASVGKSPSMINYR